MDWFLAHQGGWDEALMFIVPIVIALAAVKLAEIRGAEKGAEPEDSEPTTSQDPGPSGRSGRRRT